MSDWALNDDNDDEVADTTAARFSGREGTIYLIDADRQITGDAETFRHCLECIEADLLKSILVNGRDLVSVIFYNTQHSPLPNTEFTLGDDIATIVPAHCAIFIPLIPISKDLIQFFKDFRDSETFFDFKNKYGTSTGSSFSDALWLCSRLNIRCNYKLMSSRIFLFTNNEQPHMPGSLELQQTFVRAKDLFDNNITVDLVPMVDEFNMDLFYKEFLCAVLDLELDEFRCNSPEEQRNALLNCLFRRNFRKSCLRHVKWELGNEMSISCDIYSFTRQAKKPNSVRIYRDTNEPVIAKRVHVIQERTIAEEADPDRIVVDAEDGPDVMVTERKVLPGEMFKSQTICGKEIIFRADEVVKMKCISSPGMRLLGFKPITEFKPHWMIKHSYFLYPSESKVKGSTKLFRALWQKCLDKGKFALCVITMQRKTTPRYVALLPQTQECDGNDGFRIIYLPMETNISNLPAMETPTPEVNHEMLQFFEKLCKKLRFKYQPGLFGNPSLQHFYSKLEALVYHEVDNEMEDTTLPKVDFQDGKIAELIPLIQEVFGQDTGTKRGNDGEAGTSRPKNPKKDLSMNEIEQAVLNDRIEAVTVAHLKEFIKSKRGHVPSSAVKKNLFDVAKALIDKQP